MSLLTVLEGDAKSAFASFLPTFAASAVGTLAVAVVGEVDAEFEALTAKFTGVALDNAKREAAKTKLLNALEATGKDAATFTESMLNFLIEAAIQAGLASAVAAA